MGVIFTRDAGPRGVFAGRVTIPGVSGGFLSVAKVDAGMFFEYC